MLTRLVGAHPWEACTRKVTPVSALRRSMHHGAFTQIEQTGFLNKVSLIVGCVRVLNYETQTTYLDPFVNDLFLLGVDLVCGLGIQFEFV